MDKKNSNTRSRSKSVVVLNRRSNNVAFSQPSVDVMDSLVLASDKDNFESVDVKKMRNSETGDLLHNFNKLSVFQPNQDNVKPNLDVISLPPDKDRLIHHRFSLDVRGQIPLKQEQDEIANYRKSRHNSVFGSLQPLSSFSFHKKNVFDLEKTKTKILDPKKDSISRMRYLKQLSEKCSIPEIEDFYKKYYTFIYHTIHEYMKSTDQIKQGAVSSKQLEAKEIAVFIFEVLLCCIPNVINRKWQYHSIATVIKNMLLSDIPSKTSSDGLKLFIMWYSILMENADENEHVVFSKLLMRPEGNYDIFVFCNLLRIIVTEIKKIQWNEQINSYNFLLRRLENCYLKKLFPHYHHNDFTSFQYELFGEVEVQTEGGLLSFQRVVIDWLAAIVGLNKKAHSLSREKFGIMMEELIEKLDAEHSDECDQQAVPNEPFAGNNTLTPQNIISTGRNIQEDKHGFIFSIDERLMMQNVLFSNKSNINMTLEIFHQVFVGFFGRSTLVKEVCLIYKLWLKGQKIPIFLQPNDPKSSSSSSFHSTKVLGNEIEDFKIGKQKLIQIFICQSSASFLCDWKGLDDLNSKILKSCQDQVNVCCQILNMYRYLIMDVPMETQSWICLLEKLVKICSHVVLPTSGFGLLEELSKKIIESLLVAFVRSSLNCHVTRKQWEQMTALMTSLRNVHMVIQQWGSTMVMLTKMLGHSLYNIDFGKTADDSRKTKTKLKISKGKHSASKEADEVMKRGRVDIEKESIQYESLDSNLTSKKVLDSSFCISDAEISSDLNEIDKCAGPTPTLSTDDCSTPDTMDSTKDAQSSLGRNESSGSFENLLAGGLSVQKDSDESNSVVQTFRRNDAGHTESLEQSLQSSDGLQELVRETSIDDTQEEIDLTEIKESSFGEEDLRFIWLKMLSIFGNIASLTEHNSLIIDNLRTIHDCMLKIYRHQYFINDNKFHILIIVPWLLQIIHRPQQLLQNKLIAYSMICDYMLHVALPYDYLSRFYFSIHVGLQSTVKDISHAIVRFYSKQIFGQHFERGFILLEDFLKVALNIIQSGDELTKSQTPDKMEASRFLASVVNVPNYYRDLKMLDPESSNVRLMTRDSNQLKITVITALMNSISSNQKHSGVCSISICGLGVYLHEDILLHPKHPLIPGVIKCLLLVFQPGVLPSYTNIDKLLACQSLSILKDHYQYLLNSDFKEILWFILLHLLEYIRHSLESGSLVKEIKVVRSVMSSLLEWFLLLPVSFLLDKFKNISLLDFYFKILIRTNHMCTAGESKSHENTSGSNMLQLKIFINFVYCHLLNYVGCHLESEKISSTESQPLQPMAWFGARIFEALHSSDTNCPTPLMPCFPCKSPVYNFSVRDITGKWHWSMQAVDSINRASNTPLINVDNQSIVKILQNFQEPKINEDILIKALNLITETSPECFPSHEHQSLILPFPCLKVDKLQDDLISSFVMQQDEMFTFLKDLNEAPISCERLPININKTFYNSGMLAKISHSFGFLQFHQRTHFDFLKIGEQFMREIKHLDGQKCLEVHKIAVFYIGPNQNNRSEFLLNQKGSNIFEEFCLHLGDMIYLRDHKAYLGGLSTSGATGEVAPYYSPTSLLQVIFHVSTLLGPSHVTANDEDVTVSKMRHLGNDEVHIIWMENKKSYTNDILPTKFGEVTIVIYPLPGHLFRIQIIKKIMMDMFGPLFDGSLVGRSNLAALIRATAINAGRAIRETRDFYQKFYEERHSNLLKIVNTHKKQETFEQFLCSAMIPGAGNFVPISCLNTEASNIPEPTSPQPPVKPERRIKLDVYPNKKQRSEFLLPLKTKSEKRGQDVK